MLRTLLEVLWSAPLIWTSYVLHLLRMLCDWHAYFEGSVSRRLLGSIASAEN